MGTPTNSSAFLKGQPERPPALIASVYRKTGETNQFAYTTDELEPKEKKPARVPRRVDGPTAQNNTKKAGKEDGIDDPEKTQTNTPSGPKKMIGKQQRSQPDAKPAHRNIYGSKFFYQTETKMALATAILAPVSL